MYSNIHRKPEQGQRLYTTVIRAICPRTGELYTWAGPHVPALSMSDAEFYCQTNGLGYCKVGGILTSEIPTKDGKVDWEKQIDYDNSDN